MNLFILENILRELFKIFKEEIKKLMKFQKQL